jgi:hypothetical protein
MEYKFKGKITCCLENAGEWVYWGLGGTDMLDALDRETISQCTGYKMYSVDVYFGDLVSNNYGTDKEVVREIVEHNGCKMMKIISGKSSLPKHILLHEFFNLNFKVVGCIHQQTSHR